MESIKRKINENGDFKNSLFGIYRRVVTRFTSLGDIYRHGLRSGRASAYGMRGPGFDSRGRVIPKTLKMVVMASLLGAQELRVSITTDSSVSV